MTIANKASLIKVLSQCTFNKPIHEFMAINSFIKTIENDEVKITTIKQDNYSQDDKTLFIMLRDSKYKMITILFNTNQFLVIHNSCGCQHVIRNDGYNIQYNEIESLLLNTQ